MPFYATLCHFMMFYVISCQFLSLYVTLCHSMSLYVTPLYGKTPQRYYRIEKHACFQFKRLHYAQKLAKSGVPSVRILDKTDGI